MSISIHRDGDSKRLCVGILPGRVNPSLYFRTAMDIEVLSSFKSQGHAEAFEAYIVRAATDGARFSWADGEEDGTP